MVEAPRFNAVLLLVAMVTLATDVTRLALEWSPSRPLQDAIRKRIESGQPDVYGRAYDGRVPDPAPKDPQQQRIKPPDALGERRPLAGPRETRPPPFSRLPPDYSVRRPPWCGACRQPPRRFDWWRFD